MRVNVYAEEMTDRVEVIAKDIDGQRFTGLRLYLELPTTVGYDPTTGEPVNKAGPFVHRLGDDDSAAITFWGKRDLREVLRLMLAKLDDHYADRDPPPPAPEGGADVVPPYEGHDPIAPGEIQSYDLNAHTDRAKLAALTAAVEAETRRMAAAKLVADCPRCTSVAPCPGCAGYSVGMREAAAWVRALLPARGAEVAGKAALVTCPRCKGTGAEPGGPSGCTECSGDGKVDPTWAAPTPA